MKNTQTPSWLSVEELVGIGFARSRVVMMNEVHNGILRCIRTRLVGQRILPVAHRLGVRHLAMEALFSMFAEQANTTRQLPKRIEQLEQPEDMGYLSQPEMQVFMQDALDLGWQLVPYDFESEQLPNAPINSRRFNNWREEIQARSLTKALATLPENGKMLVWCGNNHHAKALVPQRPGEPEERWALMGYQFRELSGINPLVIDQGRTVLVPGRTRTPEIQQWLEMVKPELIAFGGTAGFLAENAPFIFGSASDVNDAYIASLDNEME